MTVVTVDALQHVMNYYHYAMIPLYCLMILLIWSCKTSLAGKITKVSSLYLALFCLISVAAHYLFLGVLADYQADVGVLLIQNHVFLVMILVAVILLFVKGGKNKEK